MKAYPQVFFKMVGNENIFTAEEFGKFLEGKEINIVIEETTLQEAN